MNTFKFIQEGGFSEEKNPKYDPTKKRSKEPETILTSNFGNQNDRFTKLARKNIEEGWFAPTEVTEKYAKKGINYNPWENLDKQLADTQSTGEKLWNSLKQTVWSFLLSLHYA